MKQKRFLFLSRLLKAGIKNGLARFFLLLAALSLSTTLAVSFVAISLGVKERIGESLQVFGANLILLPHSEKVGSGEISLGEYSTSLQSEEVEKLLKKVPSVKEFFPRWERKIFFKGREVLVLGMKREEMERAKWRIKGSIPLGGEVMLGKDLAQDMGKKIGEEIEVFGRREISGVLETGGEEDKAIIIPFSEVSKGEVSYYLLRVTPGRVEEVEKKIEALSSQVEVKTLRKVAQAEENLLKKITNLILIVATGVALASAIAVGNTLNLMVLERREEIGVLKALGATPSFISFYFFLEAFLIALLSGFVGLILGGGVAEVITLAVFEKWIFIPWQVVPVSLGLSLGIVLLSSLIPLYQASKVEAQAILKGL